MEFSRREPNPAQIQVINRLIGEGFIPPIEPSLPIEELIENNTQTVYMLNSIADYTQRQLTRGDDHEGYMLTSFQASEMIAYQKKVVSEIQRLHAIEERLVMTDSILRLTEGDMGPVSIQVMIEGSVLYSEEERVMLRDVLISEPVNYELAPTVDLNYASELLIYQTRAQQREVVEFGSQTRVELANILTNVFGNEYESVEGFRDLCAMARNIYIRRDNFAEGQLVPLLVGPFRQLALSLGISDQVIQNTLAHLNLQAADAAVELTEASNGVQVDADDMLTEVEEYLTEAAEYDDEDAYPISESERAYEEYETAARIEYLERFRELGLIPYDQNGNEVSNEDSRMFFYGATNNYEKTRMEYVAAGVAWHAMSEYGNTALQMFSISEIVARRIRYVRAAERARVAKDALTPLRKAQEIHYFIDKFIFLDAGTGVSEEYHFSDASAESVSYDCSEVLNLILEAPEFTEEEIRRLSEFFAQRYEGHYSIAEDVTDIERRRQFVEDEADRSARLDYLRSERRIAIDIILAANHHDRFSAHDDWWVFVRRLHQYGDIISLGAPAEITDNTWQTITELASRIGFEQSELDRIQQTVLDVE